MPAEFLKEGTLFMNRCTSTPSTSIPRRNVNAIYRARQEGVHQDLASSRNRFPDHGSVIAASRSIAIRTSINIGNRSYWLHCQAGPHPREQHPRRRLIDSPSIPHPLFSAFVFFSRRHIIHHTFCIAIRERDSGRFGSINRHGVPGRAVQ
jgi:hypothetical protein